MRLRRAKRALAAVAVLALIAAPAAYALVRIPTFQLFGEIVARVETDRPLVAITFDDGPSPEFTPAILDTLARHDAHATFFVMGRHVALFPEIAQRTWQEGHEIANHSYSHAMLVLTQPDHVRMEVFAADQEIRRIGYDKPTHFRSPYGAKLFVQPYVLQEMEKLNVMCDVRPKPTEHRGATAQEIYDSVLEQVRPGSIVLLHDAGEDRSATVDAVRRLVPALIERGFELVTVSELLAERERLTMASRR